MVQVGTAVSICLGTAGADCKSGVQDCNAQLEVVEKGLNQFLDTKKMAFPR